MAKGTQSSEGTDYENSNSCVACDRPDSVDDFVCCDKCNGWWHFSCAGVSSSVENRDWMCARCLPAPTKSMTTTSSTRKARIELQLKRLAEQRELDRKALDLELEKKYLADKYQLLEQSLLEDDDERHSVRTHASRKEALERVQHVAEWVEKSQTERSSVEFAPTVANQTENPAIPDVVGVEKDEGAVGGETGQKPSLLPSTHQKEPRKIHSSGESVNKEAFPALQNLLLQCQLGSQPTLKQLSELQVLVESCKLQIATQKPPPLPAAKPDHSKGAIPKTGKTLGPQSGSRAQYSAPGMQKDTTLGRRSNYAFEQMENHAAGQSQNLAPETADQSNGLSHERMSRITRQLDQEIAALRPHIPSALCDTKQFRNWGETPLEWKLPQHHRATDTPLMFPPSVAVPNATPKLTNATTMRAPWEVRFQTPAIDSTRRAPIPTPQPTSSGILVREPTAQQLAARQVLPRELPTFSGNPADWPVFISNYKYTTEACGYSDGENMIRLQRCLKGAAWESVRSRLILPTSVPQVIEALRLRYGRAELLIESLIDKAKSHPSPRSDKLESLIEFGMMVQALCDHIVAADLQDHLANPTLLKDLVNKLPADYKMQWAGYRRHQSIVNLRTFGSFMEEIVHDACSVSSVQIHEPTSKFDRSKTRDRHLVHSVIGENDTVNECKPTTQTDEVKRPIECAVCQREGHRARDCKDFHALSVDERWRKIQDLKLCRTCLFGHGRRPCRSTQKCEVDGCQARHHRLLHTSTKDNTSEVSESVQHHIYGSDNPSLFFRILPVTLHSGGKSVETYAFLDEGSSLTMVEKSLATELGVTGYAKPLCLKWTSNVTHEERDSLRVTFEVSGESNGTRYKMENVGTIETLDLPKQSVPVKQLVERYNHLRGLPIKGYHNAAPQLLIGVDNLRLLVPLKVHEGAEGSPTATKTRLGWCLYGGQRSADYHPRSYHICECGGEAAFDDAIKKYFSFEEAGIKSTLNVASEEEKRALRIMEQTTGRIGDRYQSGLLWKFDHFEFPDSYPMAYKRLQCLERRMAKDPALKENIERQINEYQTKGYAHRATPEELASADPRRTWHLPLGAVVNPNKPGKVRLIWDASAKVNGVSLNTFLLKGPDQVTSLSTVLFRFRRYRVAVSADIKEMFHQVNIRPEDRHAQRFLWRSNPAAEPEEFLMDVATFGSTCSPATAQYVKNTNAQLFAHNYPRAVEGIVLSHYVDDYLDSFQDETEAKQVAFEVKSIHGYGGFDIRSWNSNCPEVIQHLGEPASTMSQLKQLNVEKDDHSERVLGMLWATQTDELRFSATLRGDIAHIVQTGLKPTKRQILRCVMTLFDPLGLLAPFLVFGKMLIQSVWRLGIDWDDQVDDVIFERWQQWIEMFHHINEIRIPRSYFREAGPDSFRNIEIHTFVDAGKDACACVTYFRIVNAFGEVEVALVGAKTKVAPLKPMTVPRMELQACVLGARLAKFVIEGHAFPSIKSFFWSDSSTALSWINADPRKYSPFVTFRVGEILESTNRADWRWVPSQQNPADEATKWGSGPYFNTHSIWYSGPEFLRLPKDDWPTWSPTESESEELRTCCVHQEFSSPECVIEFDRFSKWSRLQRAVCYVLRFIRNCRSASRKTERDIGPLTKEELQRAERTVFYLAQWQAFPKEMAILSKNQQFPPEQRRPLDKSSSIFQLSPVLDEQGILRVDGRIGNIKGVSTDTKFPIILPRTHELSNLLVMDLHCKFDHGNKETVVNEARQRYYIPKLRSLVKSVASQCTVCKFLKAHPKVPPMAPLPLARLSPYVRPFTYVGLDYFGPLLVKFGRSQVKRWVALFTCMTTRAVHLEVAFTLTTQSSVMCVRRFLGRRGFPEEIWSDNGTNFQGAERLLRDQINDGLANTFTSSQTAWRFIPPGAPHMGGAWERLVRSVKTGLSAAYNEEKLDDEALWTLLVEIESMVNSRPLTYLPLDSAEQEALTPNHFLLGSSTGVKQPPVDKDWSSTYLKQSWNMIQDRLNAFWKRWIREYLPTLTRRSKWLSPVRNLENGDLVLIIEDTRRNGWVRGRVLEVLAAKDRKVRQAIVQTANGILRRPVSKLALLDVASDDGTKDEEWFHRGENVATTTVELAARPAESIRPARADTDLTDARQQQQLSFKQTTSNQK